MIDHRPNGTAGLARARFEPCSVAQALHRPSHTRHSQHAGSGVGCVMYTLEGTKRSSGLAGYFARNGRRTALSPNDQLVCPQDLPTNIVSNVKHVSVTPLRHCIKSK